MTCASRLALSLFLCACTPQRAPVQPAGARLPGCGRDTDCKGVRVCERGLCVEPHAEAPRDLAAPQKAEPAGPGISFGGPVPMFHGDPQHTGRSPFRAPTQAPRERWRFLTGGVVFSAPTIADDGTVLFSSHDHHVYALRPDGTLRWKRETGDLIWATPALGPGGAVYVGGDDDHLYELALSDGVVRWSLQPGACRRSVGIGPEATRCDIDQVTLSRTGTLYVGGDGVYAINPGGTVKWRFAPVGKAHCSAGPAVGPDEVIYAGCQDDGFYAINPDGTKRWEFRGQDDFDSSPAIGPDGTVYVGSDDRRLYGFGPDGKPRFAVLTEGPVRSSPAVAPDGTVYVGSYDGSLYAVRPDGTVAWTFKTADRIHSSPLIDAQGVVLFGSEDDRLYALGPDGRLLWSVLLDGDVDSTPVLGPDGTIYVGGDDKALHALR